MPAAIKFIVQSTFISGAFYLFYLFILSRV